MTQKYKINKKIKNHKIILEFSDSKIGFDAIIAIHNTNLGSALGGTRIFPYKNKTQALNDVLALSRAMTYKCAISGLPFGGGKGVIIADPKNKNIDLILKSYAMAVDSLKGLFHTGEDVGLSESQVQYMLKFSPYFIGKSHAAGDPSPFAAKSAFLCAQVANKMVFGNEELKNKKIAIKGVGKTGHSLAEFFAKTGAEIFVGDIDRSKVKTLTRKYSNIHEVSLIGIEAMNVDFFSPCAMGRDINSKNVNNIKAKIIVGTANNQLDSPEIAEALFRKGITHVPDYIANAGGLINVADELLPKGYNEDRVIKNIQQLIPTLEFVLEASKKTRRNPDLVADQLAEKKFFNNIKPEKIKNSLTLQYAK